MRDAEELNDLLFQYEQAVSESIAAELLRIQRPVQILELSTLPFYPDFNGHLSYVRLDHCRKPVVDTVFTVNGHYLTTFLCDELISHRKMISLYAPFKKLRLNAY